MNQILSMYLIFIFLFHGVLFTIWSKNSWLDVSIKCLFGFSGLASLFLALKYIGVITITWNT